MNEEVDNTQERPVLRPTRQRPDSPNNIPPERSQNVRKSAPSGQRKRSAQGQQGQRRKGQPARKAAAGQRRSQQPRNGNGTSRRPAHGRNPRRRTNTGALAAVAIVAFLCGCLLATLVTCSVMRAQVEGARAEAAAAQSEAANRAVQTVTDQHSATSATSTNATASNATASNATAANTNATNATSTGAGVEDPWLTQGTFTTGDETLDQEVKAFCDERVTTAMNVDTAALEVYKAIAWAEYVERDDAQHPAGKDWRIEYARKYYEHDCSGNCYEFAAFLMYCLRYLGYQDATAQGVAIELQSGSWGDHGLVYVTNTDGRKCLCDTSRGVDGWMLDDTVYNVEIQDFENA
ncbi:MAG: hypothetical protein IKG22_13290 [Atopobiaceae bacterium]|nr:hypothetical protein [Atopobiaceae bacterium]